MRNRDEAPQDLVTELTLLVRSMRRYYDKQIQEPTAQMELPLGSPGANLTSEVVKMVTAPPQVCTEGMKVTINEPPAPKKERKPRTPKAPQAEKAPEKKEEKPKEELAIPEDKSLAAAMDAAIAFVQRHQNAKPNGQEMARAMLKEKFNRSKIAELTHVERLEFIAALRAGMEVKA